MSVQEQSTSLNSSVASSMLENTQDPEVNKVKDYVKGLLKARIFLGRYVERRLIDQRVGYRDVIIVSPAEIEFKRDLAEAQHKLRTVYPSIHWIGISSTEFLGNSTGICIWTEIDNEPFGPFWFQIRSIKFREDEILISLKCIRHISDAFLEVEPILTGTGKKTKIEAEKTECNTAALTETYNELATTLKSALSIRNVKEFITFVCAFVIAVFTGSTAFINFLGNFILALIREMSIFIKNSTPMFLGFLDFLSKIVGGFYILLAMFFKPSNPGPQNRRAVEYDQSFRTPTTRRYNQQYDKNHYDSCID